MQGRLLFIQDADSVPVACHHFPRSQEAVLHTPVAVRRLDEKPRARMGMFLLVHIAPRGEST